MSNIAADIAKLDATKLNALNGANKASAQGGIIGKEDVDNMRQYNVETEKQNTFFGDYNRQKELLNQQLQQQKANQEAVKKSIEQEMVVMDAYAKQYLRIKNQRIALEAQYANTSKMDIQRRIQLNAQIQALKTSEAQLLNQLQKTNAQFIDQSQRLAEVETALQDTEKQIAKLGAG